MTPPGDFAHHPLFPRLVFAAYLLLAPIRDPRARIARARRLATSVLVRRLPSDDAASDALYWKLLGRMARKATGVRSRFMLSWTNWAKVQTKPGDVEHLVVDAHLAAATPHARLGYVLLVAEKLAPDAAFERLSSLKVRGKAGGADGVVAAGVALRELLVDEGITVRRQRELLAEAPASTQIADLAAPSAGRLRARSAFRWAFVVVPLTVVLLVTFLVLPGSKDSEDASSTAAPLPTVQRVDASDWTTATDMGLAVWPTRGALAQDGQLIDRALRAWRDAAQQGSTQAAADEVQLLYAGPVDTQTIVALTDGLRVARYVDSTAVIRVDLAPRGNVYGSSALALTDGDNGSAGTTYLLAPWVTAASSGSLTADWSSVPVTDGLTTPVPRVASSTCAPGAVLQLRARGVQVPFAVADFGRTTLTHLMYVPSSFDAPVVRPHELDMLAGRTFARMGCQLGDANGAQTDSITVWKLWSGKLPESADISSVVCVRSSRADGASTVTTSLLPSENDAATGIGQANGGQACSRSAQNVVVSGWWQASSGAWYYLAVGSRKVTEISVAGGGLPEKSGARLVSYGPFPNRDQTMFTVTATSSDGAAVPVLS